MAEAVKETPKATPPAAAKAATANGDKSLFPESRVKEYVKSKELRISSEALPVLDAKIKKLLVEAGARAKGNKRGTIQAQDL